ncbi:uncharacterized protein N7484_006479 [Penicillium longicatenatum]|uniref:uncharacterized protein n=1 Tax=Penicillium longicatenatum TaxID=1561947 RepID=UPI002549952F|nr:uncharacterized protein N7484_006479 [Penicillium longicatenatum]KAJ5643972.1 hypothetical protein N7484_006479 [Penicillium longicatenatum]
MPLHLLGKKSWNVYNPENVARVKRDEAQAKALEEEDERRMQEVDAERRIRILRGERVPTPPPPPPTRLASEALSRPERTSADEAGRTRKRRRIAGEDDTVRDIRFAREDAEQASAKRAESTVAALRKNKKSDAPILDRDGHINLFPAEGSNKHAAKNKEAEAEAQKEKRSFEDQYTMRFSNAAGFKQSIGQDPWYSSSAQAVDAPDTRSKNVWGNEDPMRKEREKVRMDANDPLAAMKRGIRQLKATEQERKRWNEEKKKELEALKSEQGSRDRSSHHRRRRSRSVDSLEGFKLGAPAVKDRDGKNHGTSRRHHHRHHRDRSRDRHGEILSRRSHRSSDRTNRRRDETHGTQRSRRPENEAGYAKR